MKRKKREMVNTYKKCFRRLISLSLVICMLLTSIPASVLATIPPSIPSVYVKAGLVTDGSVEALELKNYNGEAYISAENVARLAEMKLSIQNGVLTFWTEKCSFTYEVKDALDADGRGSLSSWYVPLKKTADALSLSYYYDLDSQILLFNPRELFVEELVDYCRGIYEGPLGYSPYDVAYIYETSLAWVATVYNVFTGGKILHWLVGAYGIEQNKEAIGSILTNPDGGVSEIEAFLRARNTDVKTVMDLLAKEDKAEVKTIEFLESQGVDLHEQFAGCLEMFGRPYADAVAIYKAANTVKGLTPTDLLDVYHNVNLKNTAASIYLKAFKYGLGENGNIQNRALYEATKSMYAFTREQEMDTARILTDKLLEVAGENLAEGASKLIEDCGFKTNSIVVGIATWVADQFVADKTNAVDQAKSYAAIQTAIEDIIWAVGDPDHTLFDPLALKYATILYVRACQCCFHNFLETDGTEAAAARMVELSKNEILNLAAFDDDQLTLVVENDPLNLQAPGIVQEVTALPVLSKDVQLSIADIPHAATTYLLAQDGMTKVYRLDSNEDQAQEWILKKNAGQDIWCVMDGGTASVQVDVFASSNVTESVELYQCHRHLNLLVSGKNEVLYPSYWIYDRGLGIPFLYQTHPDCWTDGETYFSSEEAEDILEHHKLLDIEDREVTGIYDFTMNLPVAEIGRITNQLAAHQNVKNRVVLDLNGDTVEDGVLFYQNNFAMNTYVDGELQEDFNLVNAEPECAALLLSEYGKIHVQILETAEVQALIDQVVQTQEIQRLSQEAMANGMGNGDYTIILHKNQIQPLVGGGWTATVERLGYVTYTDAEVQNWKPGMVINGVTVNSIRKDLSQTPHTMQINGFEMLFVKYDDGLWYQTAENDNILQANLGYVTLVLSPALVCYDQDEMTAGLPLVAVPDLNWFFTEYGRDSLKMGVTMKDGIVTELIHWYMP